MLALPGAWMHVYAPHHAVHATHAAAAVKAGAVKATAGHAAATHSVGTKAVASVGHAKASVAAKASVGHHQHLAAKSVKTAANVQHKTGSVVHKRGAVVARPLQPKLQPKHHHCSRTDRWLGRCPEQPWIGKFSL